MLKKKEVIDAWHCFRNKPKFKRRITLSIMHRKKETHLRKKWKMQTFFYNVWFKFSFKESNFWLLVIIGKVHPAEIFVHVLPKYFKKEKLSDCDISFGHYSHFIRLCFNDNFLSPPTNLRWPAAAAMF